MAQLHITVSPAFSAYFLLKLAQY